MSMITAIGDAVVTAINVAAFGGFTYTAKRLSIPKLDLEVTKALQILVITPSIERTRHNRSAFLNTSIIEVGVLQIVQKAEPLFTDPLIGLVESINQIDYEDVTFGGRNASFSKSEPKPLYDADALEQSSQFVSVTRITYLDLK